jgi:1,4-alpha-glucan branching enzyme
MHTACSLENRDRATRFTLPVIRQRARRLLRAIPTQAVKSGARTKVIRAIQAAEKAAAKHAIHFLEQRREQIREIGEFDFAPIIVAPFDAELFGHWWFEGPIFLEQFIRHAANERDFCLGTPSEYLAAHPTQQIVEPAASTWGEKGHLAIWLDPSNAWIYAHLHAAALRMSDIAKQYAAHGSDMTATSDRVLKQLARELLLAQSSDWAFLIKTGTAREYATKRTIDHLARFNRLHDQFVTNDLDEEFLGDCEWRDNIFPNVNWRYYI